MLFLFSLKDGVLPVCTTFPVLRCHAAQKDPILALLATAAPQLAAAEGAKKCSLV